MTSVEAVERNTLTINCNISNLCCWRPHFVRPTRMDSAEQGGDAECWGTREFFASSQFLPYESETEMEPSWLSSNGAYGTDDRPAVLDFFTVYPPSFFFNDPVRGEQMQFMDARQGIMDNDFWVLMGRERRYHPDISMPPTSLEEFRPNMEEDGSHDPDGVEEDQGKP